MQLKMLSPLHRAEPWKCPPERWMEAHCSQKVWRTFISSIRSERQRHSQAKENVCCWFYWALLISHSSWTEKVETQTHLWQQWVYQELTVESDLPPWWTCAKWEDNLIMTTESWGLCDLAILFTWNKMSHRMFQWSVEFQVSPPLFLSVFSFSLFLDCM